MRGKVPVGEDAEETQQAEFHPAAGMDGLGFYWYGIQLFCVLVVPSDCMTIIEGDICANREVDGAVRGNGHAPSEELPGVGMVNLIWPVEGQSYYGRGGRVLEVG